MSDRIVHLGCSPNGQATQSVIIWQHFKKRLDMRLMSVLLSVVGVSLLSGCASLMVASTSVIAIVKDDLFTGNALGYANRTGTIKLASVLNPDIQCIGNFAYVDTKMGGGDLRCNDGSAGTFQFNGLTMFSGYGFGTMTLGSISFTFGLNTAEAGEYLRLPKGKVLKGEVKGNNASLVDIGT